MEELDAMALPIGRTPRRSINYLLATGWRQQGNATAKKQSTKSSTGAKVNVKFVISQIFYI